MSGLSDKARQYTIWLINTPDRIYRRNRREAVFLFGHIVSKCGELASNSSDERGRPGGAAAQGPAAEEVKIVRRAVWVGPKGQKNLQNKKSRK
jgi:hypothetical protein